MRTPSDIVNLWPRKADFARAIGVEWTTAHAWTRRFRIPQDYWPAIVDAAKALGRTDVTTETLQSVCRARKVRKAHSSHDRIVKTPDSLSAECTMESRQ